MRAKRPKGPQLLTLPFKETLESTFALKSAAPVLSFEYELVERIAGNMRMVTAFVKKHPDGTLNLHHMMEDRDPQRHDMMAAGEVLGMLANSIKHKWREPDGREGS